MRLAATSACTSSSNLTFHFTPLASKTLIFGLVPVTSSLSNLKGGFGMPTSLPIPMNRFSLEMSPRSSQIAGAPALVGAVDTFLAPFPLEAPLSADGWLFAVSSDSFLDVFSFFESFPFFCGARWALASAGDVVKALATAKQITSAKEKIRDETQRDT